MGGENALLQDVVGSVVIGNNECMEEVVEVEEESLHRKWGN